MPANVRHLGHVGTRDHNAFNASSLAVLNIARDSMAAVGFSPATRVFEAAGAGACLITDAWTGLELFLKEGEEVLVGARRRGRGGASRGPHARARARHRRGRAGAHPGRAHLRPPRRAGGRAAPGGGGPQAPRRAREGRGVTGPPLPPHLRVVVLGLSLSSSWGNGHATTWRALLKAFAARGHEVLFLERDVPWYAAHRDLPDPRLLPPRAVPGPRRARGGASRRDRRGRCGDRRLLRAGGRGGRPSRAGMGARRHRLLRHRHAGDARQARARRRGVSVAGAHPRLRPLSVLHRRADARPPGAALRRARGARRSSAPWTRRPTGPCPTRRCAGT